MKLVVFGATGNVGQRIVREAVSRGHEVIGVVRSPETQKSADANATLVKGDATDAASVAKIAKGADAIVSAISPRVNSRGLPAPLLVDAARAVIAGATKAGVKRVIFVGGAGSLEVAPGKRLMDEPGFPAPYKPEAIEGADMLDIVRKEAGALEWSYISPAAEISAGHRTGRYRTTGDQYIPDAKGQSRISFEDFAVAVVDELEHGNHVRARFGVAY
jgi:putative NADH-flavin reductase